MKYRVSEEEIKEDWVKYRNEYPPFYPYKLSDLERHKVAYFFSNLLTTQNGADFDDYCVSDEKDLVGRYLGEVPPGSEVLLHGVGTGREVVVAKNLGLKVVGTTLGSRNVEFGKRFLGLTDRDISEQLCEALPYPSNRFDIVAGFQIFEHAIAPLMFLLEQYRVLKVGGHLMLEWPPAKKYSMDGNPHHQICYTPGQARALFLKAGFKDIKLYYDNLTPIPEEDMWRADQNCMLFIDGKKATSDQEYIKQHCRGL